jgi:hypothetical protein
MNKKVVKVYHYKNDEEYEVDRLLVMIEELEELRKKYDNLQFSIIPESFGDRFEFYIYE